MRAVVPVLALVVACGGAATGELDTPAPPGLTAPPPIADEDVAGLVAGEIMRFDVKVAGVLAGEAQVAVGEPGLVGGVRAVAVSSRIASAGALALIKEVRDEGTSIIDMDRLAPISSKADVAFGDKRYHADAWFEPHAATIEYQPEGRSSLTIRYRFGDQEVHDALSAMAKVRTWRAEPGDRLGLWMIGGRRIWRSEIWSVGPEVIGTRLGNQPTLRLDGTSHRALADLKLDPTKKPRSFSVWLSDDADRVPLLVKAKTEYGDLTIELVDYQRPE
ncbi:MAG TPA: DUF3108 domain-containing protein [Kofleriaceae bacterium]|jgi:hypothetical protein|nr:DUF3108 domain-containing protein [Kofleriaceae bacterium]